MRTGKLHQGAEESLRKHGVKLVLAGALRFLGCLRCRRRRLSRGRGGVVRLALGSMKGRSPVSSHRITKPGVQIKKWTRIDVAKRL